MLNLLASNESIEREEKRKECASNFNQLMKHNKCVFFFHWTSFFFHMASGSLPLKQTRDQEAEETRVLQADIVIVIRKKDEGMRRRSKQKQKERKKEKSTSAQVKCEQMEKEDTRKNATGRSERGRKRKRRRRRRKRERERILHSPPLQFKSKLYASKVNASIIFFIYILSFTLNILPHFSASRLIVFTVSCLYHMQVRNFRT